MEFYGKHAVSNMDLMDFTVLPNGEKADIFYCDPPWGQGMIKFFRSLNNKMNDLHSNKATSLDDFLAKLFAVAKDNSKGVILIENGTKWDADIKAYGQRAGLHYLAIANPRYGSKNLPLHLHIFHKQGIVLPEGYVDSIKDTKGLNTIRAAIKPWIVPGGIIFDPCCGCGMTAQIGLESGMVFRGNEINKAKLETTIKTISG